MGLEMLEEKRRAPFPSVDLTDSCFQTHTSSLWQLSSPRLFPSFLAPTFFLLPGRLWEGLDTTSISFLTSAPPVYHLKEKRCADGEEKRREKVPAGKEEQKEKSRHLEEETNVWWKPRQGSLERKDVPRFKPDVCFLLLSHKG